MNIKNVFEYAVVLAPAFIAMMMLTVPLLRRWLSSAWKNVHMVDFVKDMFLRAAFFGSAATIYIGYTEQPLTGVIAIVWFAVSIRVSYILLKRSEQLTEEGSYA